jgi:hypothetical protein
MASPMALNGGLRTQERRWRDDHCSDPEVAEAIANEAGPSGR